MKQVTGRSCNNSTTKASIRLASGGRFFSASVINGIAECEDVEVIVDTPRASLVPAAMADAVPAQRILELSQLECNQDEIAIYSQEKGARKAAIAISATAYNALIERFGSRLHITTPLLNETHSNEQCLAIEVGEYCGYIRAYKNGLRFAETVELSSGEDLLYYITKVLEVVKLPTNTPIYIVADKSLCKRVKKYYKIICE